MQMEMKNLFFKIWWAFLVFLEFLLLENPGWTQIPRFKNAQRIGGSNYEQLIQIEYGKDGSRYLAFGSQSDAIFFGSTTIPANQPYGGQRYTSLICKVDKNNQILWTIKSQANLNGYLRLGHFALDSKDNLYFDVLFITNTNFLGVNLIYDGNGVNNRLIKLNKSGNLIWVKNTKTRIGLSSRCYGKNIYFFRPTSSQNDTRDGFIFYDSLASVLKMDTKVNFIIRYEERIYVRIIDIIINIYTIY